MRLPLALAAAFLTAVIAVPALSADNVIKQRQAIMKRIGEQTDLGADMLKGKVAYDPAKAAAIFASYKGALSGVAALFPPGSDTGDTKATAAVWSNRAGFEAAIAAFDKAVADNAAGAGTADGFKTSFTAVANTCRSCHQDFKSR